MSASFERVTDEAMSLSEGKRTKLAYRLLDSVGPPDPHAHLTDAAFAEMLAKRARDVESGVAKTIPAEEVIARLRQKYTRG